MAYALVQVNHIQVTAATARQVFEGRRHVVRLRRGATEETVSASGHSKSEAAMEAMKKAIDDGWF